MVAVPYWGIEVPGEVVGDFFRSTDFLLFGETRIETGLIINREAFRIVEITYGIVLRGRNVPLLPIQRTHPVGLCCKDQ